MPMNLVKVNNKEYEVPDSWMPPLMSYLILVKSKVEIRGEEKLLCQSCGSKKLFKGKQCEDCWYEEVGKEENE